jgi:hypothetical protein
MPITLNGSTGLVTPGMTLGSSVVDVPSGSAPGYLCRAWVNFNGTGTVAIRASGNVSSITDINIGQYTLNFTTAMPDINYAPVATCTHAAGVAAEGIVSFLANPLGTTSSFSFYTTWGNGSGFDPFCVAVAVFR